MTQFFGAQSGTSRGGADSSALPSSGPRSPSKRETRARFPSITAEGNETQMIGQLIGGRYLLTGVLGEGGMGVVYVGEQRMGSTVRKVAIKTLHQDLAADPSLVARFHREC